MKKKVDEQGLCNKGHEKDIVVYCTKCGIWVCGGCKANHLDHEGLLKDFEELTNQNIQVYAEHLKVLKNFFKLLERTPGDSEYEDIKQEMLLKINAAYEQLVSQLNKHRDMQIKRIGEYIEHAKKKRQRLEQEAKTHEAYIGKLKKILTKLRKCNVSKIPKRYLLKYNNTNRVQVHEDEIEHVKKTFDRCTKVYEKYVRLKNIEVKVQVKEAYINKMIKIPSNLKDEQRLLLIQPKTRNIIVANIESMKKRLVQLSDKAFIIPSFFEFIETKHKIIMCGGTSEEDKFLANTYEISVDSGTVKELAPMNIGKKYHSLCSLSSTEIFSVGGLGPTGALKTCELLNLCSNEWGIQCPLNEEREGPTTCSISNKYMYCIGGRASESQLSCSLEVIDISYPKLGWNIIQLQQEIYQPMYFGVCWPINSKQIMIAGGLTSGEIPLARSYIFDVETYEIAEGSAMKQPDCFLEREHKLYNNKFYAIGYSSYAIHIFDVVKHEWDIIKSSATIQEEEKKA